MAVGSLECSRPSAWPSSWTATRNKSLPEHAKRGETEQSVSAVFTAFYISHKLHLLRLAVTVTFLQNKANFWVKETIEAK